MTPDLFCVCGDRQSVHFKKPDGTEECDGWCKHEEWGPCTGFVEHDEQPTEEESMLL